MSFAILTVIELAPMLSVSIETLQGLGREF